MLAVGLLLFRVPFGVAVRPAWPWLSGLLRLAPRQEAPPGAGQR